MGRAILILGWLARNSKGSLPDICAALRLPKSSTYGLLLTLMDHGYVERAPDGQFTLGLKVVSLGSAALARLDIREWALPVMHRLAAATEDTIHLAVLQRGNVIFTDRVNSPSSVLVAHIGFHSPPTCSALGLVLLSDLSEEELKALERSGSLVKCTPQTIADLEGLEPVLQQVRERGYAFDDRSQHPQVRSVAAPIRNHLGKAVAAVSASGIVGRFTDERMPELIRQVVGAAREISVAMGYPSEPAPPM